LLLKSSFGFEEKYILQWSRIPLTLNIPIVEAVRNNSEALCLTKEVFFANYPEVNSLGTVETNWESCVASSIQSKGVYMLVLNSVPKVNADFKCFLQTIGHLISLHLDEERDHQESVVQSLLPRRELTPRQELISDLLVKGFSNPYIAQEIGYSESLVRQETIIIYAAMRVSGRKELMNLLEKQGAKQA
jgi:DNA-binding CsgD family transcriptional regulator